MEVGDRIHRVTGGVVNFYVLEEGGKLVLVDAGTPRDWDTLVTALRGLGRTTSDVEAVVLTHAHSDHTGFAERARAEAGSRVYVHQADLAVATGAKPPKNERSIAAYLLRVEAYRTAISLARRGGVKIIPVHEASSFRDGEELDVPGRPRVIHVPGHTDGMTALFVESRRALLTGDALVTRNPLTGRVGPQVSPGGLNQDSNQALRSLEAVAGLDVDVILPGHGEPWREGAAEAVRRARAAGTS